MINFLRKILTMVLSLLLVVSLGACNEVDPPKIISTVTKANIDEEIAKIQKDGEITLSDGEYNILTINFTNDTIKKSGDGNLMPYCGVRNLGEVVFQGTKNAVVKGFDILSNNKSMYVDKLDANGNATGSRVRETYEPYFNIKTLKFKGMTFIDKLYFGNVVRTTGRTKKEVIENLIFEDVTFDFSKLAEEQAEGLEESALILEQLTCIYFSFYGDEIKNITFKNCTFEKCDAIPKTRLIEITANDTNKTNLTITNCNFKGAGWNALQLSSNDGNIHQSAITLNNNTFTGRYNRALRITAFSGNFTMSNNQFNDCVYDSDNEVFKIDYHMGSNINIDATNSFNGAIQNLYEYPID